MRAGPPDALLRSASRSECGGVSDLAELGAQLAGTGALLVVGDTHPPGSDVDGDLLDAAPACTPSPTPSPHPPQRPAQRPARAPRPQSPAAPSCQAPLHAIWGRRRDARGPRPGTEILTGVLEAQCATHQGHGPGARLLYGLRYQHALGVGGHPTPISRRRGVLTG